MRLALLVCGLLAALASPGARAQDPAGTLPAGILPTDTLTGTLKTLKERGAITLGVRDSSPPFSFTRPGGRQVGYAIDLCREVAAEVAAELGIPPLEIRHKVVTSESRFAALTGGEIDLECGSTTNNRIRQRDVAFSPVTFVAGTKLLVKQASAVGSYRQLAGKTVVVTAGTTNEAAIKALSDKQGLGIRLVRAPDHAASFAMVQSGEADAMAGDDVLLYGLMASAPAELRAKVVGEYLSYDPYGLMFRRDDPAFAAVVERTFRRLAEQREIVRLYDTWFLKPLPGARPLNLPMSPQLEELFHIMGVPDS